jgi:hypothetical protein
VQQHFYFFADNNLRGYKTMNSHKKRLNIFLAVKVSMIIFISLSCKKETIDQDPPNPPVERKIQFGLFTDKNFSTDHDNITFTLFIQKATDQILWDSVLAPMQVKDIPSVQNKLVIQKLVPPNDGSLLKVGFHYAIDNIGYSWYFDSCNVGQNFKIVDFNFQ